MYLKAYKKAAMIIMTAASERMTGLGPIRLFFAPSLYKGMRMAVFFQTERKNFTKKISADIFPETDADNQSIHLVCTGFHDPGRM